MLVMKPNHAQITASTGIILTVVVVSAHVELSHVMVPFMQMLESSIAL